MGTLFGGGFDGTPAAPWVELAPTCSVPLACVLCGGDLGPQRTHAQLLSPDKPRPSLIGYACVACLSRNSFELAEAIEEHVEWLTETAGQLAEVAKLARAGKLCRPSVKDWHAVNTSDGL